MTETLDTSLDVVSAPTASEVHPRLAQRALVPGSLNGLDEPGPPGADGAPGQPGQGVPAGGTAGQVLAKVDDDDYDTEWVDAPTGGGGGSAVVAGPPITGAITVAPNTFYPINLAANLGNVAITMPAAPDQGSVVEFVRQDTNVFTSTARVTAGAGDNIGDTSPYVITVRNVLIRFTYEGTTWWPATPVGGASGLLGATPSSAFNPSLMSRDVNGRAQIEDPVAAKDIVNLEYLQAHGGSGGGSDEVSIRPDDPTVPVPTAELWVDTDDNSAGISVPTLVTDWNNAIPGGYYNAGGSTPNAPTTSSYAGITYTDGQPGHFTQVVYRIASTSTSVEQWQRQMIGGTSWTPWRPIAGPDSGWQDVTGVSGWTISSTSIQWQMRQIGNRVYLRGGMSNSSFSGGYTQVGSIPASIPPPPYASVWPILGNTTIVRALYIDVNGKFQMYASAATSSAAYINGMDYFLD